MLEPESAIVIGNNDSERPRIFTRQKVPAVLRLRLHRQNSTSRLQPIGILLTTVNPHVATARGRALQDSLRSMVGWLV